MALRGEAETLQSLVEMSAFLGAWLQVLMGAELGAYLVVKFFVEMSIHIPRA